MDGFTIFIVAVSTAIAGSVLLNRTRLRSLSAFATIFTQKKERMVHWGWKIYYALLWPYGIFGTFSGAIMIAVNLGERHGLVLAGCVIIIASLFEGNIRRSKSGGRQRRAAPFPRAGLVVEQPSARHRHKLPISWRSRLPLR